MPYTATIRRYLTDLQREYNSAIRGGQHTAELSFRPVLDQLIRNLANDLHPDREVDVVLEPRNQGRVGRPDWRIHDSNSLGIYGYIEAKGLTESPFDTTPYQEQFDRYLTLGHKLVITDGIDFVFCMQQGVAPVVISLIDKGLLGRADWSRILPNPQFEIFMRQFFENPAPQQCDEGKLVELVALRTRLLADDIKHYISIPLDEAMNEDERQSILLLSGIRDLVYNHNDHHMRTDKVFADFTAQVIMFCLLYAHRVVCDGQDTPVVKEDKIRQYAFGDIIEGEALLPFRNLMVYLRDNADTGLFISHWVEECIKFLSFVQMTEDQILHPDYHQLFELFLSKYDPQSRFDYGAYYTPKILASFVVRLTEALVRSNFDGASIYDAQNTIVDPCCGTGSFLEEIIAHDTNDGNYNLCGFEILPAPYMLANYRMSLVRRNLGQRQHSTNILLANTLSNCVFGEPANENSIEGNELSRANTWASMPLKLIIGNPPCSDSTRQNIGDEFSIINSLMEDFRPPQEARRARQNTQKQINNPFMQFLRWSCVKLLNSQNHSVLSMVVPLSFLEAESYRYARKYLCEQFSDAWIISVDADARTGIRSNSLFHTLQGRAVIILTRHYGETPGFQNYHYIDFSNIGMAQKEAQLAADTVSLLREFREFEVEQTNFSFVPTKPFNEDQYKRFWAVSGENGQQAVFNQHCSGIKLAPTAIFTHVKVPMLKRRCRDILANGTVSAHEWFSGQDRPPDDEKVSAFQTALRNCGNAQSIDATLTNNIKTYSFRPYLTSNVLLWQDVLRNYSTIGGGGTRLRPEIVKGFANEETIGFAMAHAPKDLNPSLSQFVSFCWYYPDNDMCSRGNSHIYMNQYVDKRTGVFSNNINTRLLQSLSETLLRDHDQIAKDMVFYVYAILCSQVYLDEFEGALFTVNQSDNRARVPVVADRDIFEQIVELGKNLAELEKADYVPENLLGYDYDAICSQIPNGFHLRNTSHPFDEENEQLILSDGRTEIRIECPIALQKLNISGYDVVKNIWLKFHSYDFTHCDFTRDDILKLLNFMNTLEMHTRIVAQIDNVIPSILSGNVSIILPDGQ